MKTRIRGLAMSLVLALAVTGCASAAAASGGAPSARTTLTAEQLAGSNSDNLFDAINKLRPEWLSARGTQSVSDPSPAVASVFLGGSYLGKVEALKEMRVLDVTAVRYWDAGSASARFGMGHPRGVIELTRK